MSNRKSSVRRRREYEAGSWPVFWRVTMPAVRDSDNDWLWFETADESQARRRCTALRRSGWPVRLERVQQQPLLPHGAERVEHMRAQHELSSGQHTRQ